MTENRINPTISFKTSKKGFFTQEYDWRELGNFLGSKLEDHEKRIKMIFGIVSQDPITGFFIKGIPLNKLENSIQCEKKKLTR
jgi:hypothetical protein